jgi:malonate-semialdehyde dehydrogenase (acetylating)/methylmalonate-semialdehyde dehydrogenase
VLFSFRELLNARKEELAEVITAEHGKVLSDALGEVTRGLEVVEFACGIPHLLKGGFSSGVSSGVDVHSVRQPVGVSADHQPVQLPGDGAVLVLPARDRGRQHRGAQAEREGPERANWLAALWQEAGLPDGVFNVLHGDKVAVDGLLEHPDVATVSFVGSTPIARYVYERGTAHGKRVQALGGAKNHMVVLPDADLDLAADAAVNAGFGSAGERCMAISRWWWSTASPTSWWGGSATASRRCAPATAARAATWGRWSPAPTATRWPPTSTRACRPERRWSSTGATRRWTATAAASGWAPRCSTASSRR